jgi:hypothetical protein
MSGLRGMGREKRGLGGLVGSKKRKLWPIGIHENLFIIRDK